MFVWLLSLLPWILCYQSAQYNRISVYPTNARATNRQLIQNQMQQFETYEEDLFLMKIYIGTPPQQFNVIFDTGSDVPYVNSADCPTCNHENRTGFDSSKSSTFVDYYSQYTIHYVQSASHGIFAGETVKLFNMQLRNFTLLLIDDISIQKHDLKSVGQALIGLSPSKSYLNFFEQTVINKLIESSIFAFDLKVKADKSLFLYNIKPDQFPGVTYLNIHSDYWQIGNRAIDIKTINFDSGAPYPVCMQKQYYDILVKEYFSQCEPYSVYLICSAHQKYPDITIELKNYTIRITPQMYMQPLSIFQYLFRISSNNHVTILGTGVMEHYLVIHDKKQSRMGLQRKYSLNYDSRFQITLFGFGRNSYLLVIAQVYLICRICLQIRRSSNAKAKINLIQTDIEMESTQR